MITFKSDCEDCNKIAQKVQSKTMAFLMELIKELRGNNEVEHIPATALMLMVMGAVGAVTDEALNGDIAILANDSGMSKEEKAREVDKLLGTTINTCMEILSDFLPIDVMGSEKVAREDVSKVVDFAAALKTKKGTIQ